MAALSHLNDDLAFPRREPGWLSEPEIVREERAIPEWLRDEWEAEDARQYGTGSSSDMDAGGAA